MPLVLVSSLCASAMHQDFVCHACNPGAYQSAAQLQVRAQPVCVSIRWLAAGGREHVEFGWQHLCSKLRAAGPAGAPAAALAARSYGFFSRHVARPGAPTLAMGRLNGRVLQKCCSLPPECMGFIGTKMVM